MSEFHATEEEHEEENYFISMTDMMVGMLFLFIIMLMMFALNFKKGDDASERIRKCLLSVVEENAKVSKEINEKIENVQKAIEEPLKALELAADQRQRLLSDLKDSLNAKGISQVEIDEKTMFCGSLRARSASIPISSISTPERRTASSGLQGHCPR
jgi:chemotaxis protein MotB